MEKIVSSQKEKMPCIAYLIRSIELPNSSIIHSLEYNMDKNMLRITFYDNNVKNKPGEKYCYMEVPSKVVSEMMLSPSVGSFFVKNIKNKYRFFRCF